MSNKSIFARVLDFIKDIILKPFKGSSDARQNVVIDDEQLNGKNEPVDLCDKSNEDNGEKQSQKSLTKSQSIALNFWTRLIEKIADKGSKLSTKKPRVDSWYDFSIGSSKAFVRISLGTRDKYVSVILWISDDKELFDELEKSKKEIERKLKLSLDWDRKDDRKAATISTKIYDVDFDNPQSWDALYDDLIEKCELFQRVFIEYVK